MGTFSCANRGEDMNLSLSCMFVIPISNGNDENF